MIRRRKLLLLMVCNRCKAELPIAFGYNSFSFTPEQAAQRFRCLGWSAKGKTHQCPACSGLPVMTAKAVLTDFMNFMSRTNQTVIPHPKDQQPDWSGSTIFGRKTPLRNN